MSEDYTPSMDDIAEYYTACKMRGYDEVQGGEPYAIVRARYKEGFNHVIAAHDAELRETWREPSVEAIAVMLRHTFDWDGEVILTDVVEAVLSCRHSSILQHDTELREQIARDIEARKPRASKLSEYVTGVRRGIYLAASIARGKEQA